MIISDKERELLEEIAINIKILMDKEKEGFPITALREIKILQELRHENIVRLIEVCRSSSMLKNIFNIEKLNRKCQNFFIYNIYFAYRFEMLIVELFIS